MNPLMDFKIKDARYTYSAWHKCRSYTVHKCYVTSNTISPLTSAYIRTKYIEGTRATSKEWVTDAGYTWLKIKGYA